MIARWLLAAGLVLGLLRCGAPAAEPPAPPKPASTPPLAPLPGNGSNDAVAAALRNCVLQSLPTPLYEGYHGWGQTRRVANGVKWSGEVLPLRPKVQHAERNNGTWRKIRITAENLPNSLVFALSDVRPIESGRTAFTVSLSFDARVHYEKQVWEAGVRLLSDSARARIRVRLTLNCEVSARFEPTGRLLPDAVFRLRVSHSDLGYDHFVMEHVAGVGGDLAKVLGDTVKGTLHRFDPALERHLLEKANAAIEKAADTKEVRLSLGSLLKN